MARRIPARRGRAASAYLRLQTDSISDKSEQRLSHGGDAEDETIETGQENGG